MQKEIEDKVSQLDAMVSPESIWLTERLGKFTSSKIDKLLTEPKTEKAKKNGELSVAANTYIREKVAEIITGATRRVTSYAIEWGNLYEPEAAEHLQKLYPDMVYMGKLNPKFFKFNDSSGGSPDGVDYKNLIVFEIKCPEDPANHIEYCMLDSAAKLKECEREYYNQLQMNMLSVSIEQGVSFFKMKGVFATYHPLVKSPYPKIKVLPVFPDQEFYEKIEPAINSASQHLRGILSKLNPGPDNSPSGLVAEYKPDGGVTIVESINQIPLIKINS